MIFSIDQKPENTEALRAEDGSSFTYGALKDGIRQIGSVMRQCGREVERLQEPCCASETEPRHRRLGQEEKPCGNRRRILMFCLCKNVPGAVIGYLGALESDVVPLLLDAGLAEEQLAAFFHSYEPALTWCPSETENGIEGRMGVKVYEAWGYSLWQTGCPSCLMYPGLALLLATSGSTGNPRLVRLSRENIEHNAASIKMYLGLNERQRPITTLPMQYTYGLSILHSHLLAGACILMTTASVVEQRFWNFLEEQGATSFGGVPYTYEILRRMRIFSRDIPSLTSITQAGGKLPEELQREVALWARNRGILFFIMYGQTEATARMGYLPPEDCLEKVGSMGIVIPGGEFSLEDDNGCKIREANQVGNLIYRGKNVSLGYAREKEDLQQGDLWGGVLHTGDLAKRDEDGYYYIVGRKKRFIKLFGVRIGLDECEQLLREHFGERKKACGGAEGRAEAANGEGASCLEVACTGTDDHMEIYVTDEALTQKAVSFLAEYLHINKKAFCGKYLPYLPKSPAGKVLYGQLEQKGSTGAD